MKTILVSLLIWGTLSSVFADCEVHEADYEMAEYVLQEKQADSYRMLYDEINTLINTATDYLCYCQKELTLAQQYELQQVIKRADKKRRDYFVKAVHEYHVILGIRPNVKEVYQQTGFSNGRSIKGASTPRLPTVRQPMMPPVR